jgi:hypothetical protein
MSSRFLLTGCTWTWLIKQKCQLKYFNHATHKLYRSTKQKTLHCHADADLMLSLFNSVTLNSEILLFRMIPLNTFINKLRACLLPSTRGKKMRSELIVTVYVGKKNLIRGLNQQILLFRKCYSTLFMTSKYILLIPRVLLPIKLKVLHFLIMYFSCFLYYDIYLSYSLRRYCSLSNEIL